MSDRDNAIAAKLIQQSLLSSFAVRSCLNCEHFDHWTEGAKGTCRIAKSVPPVHVAVFGCEQWTPDIPF